MTARQASPEEDDAIWSQVAELNPGFDEYRRVATRQIPVILLQPEPGSGD